MIIIQSITNLLLKSLNGLPVVKEIWLVVFGDHVTLDDLQCYTGAGLLEDYNVERDLKKQAKKNHQRILQEDDGVSEEMDRWNTVTRHRMRK